jgi:hypothetical protein
VPQFQWCPAAALQAERLHDGGHSMKLCARLSVFKQASSLFLMLVANSVFTLGIIRTLAHNELDLCIRHQHLFEEEPQQNKKGSDQ